MIPRNILALGAQATYGWLAYHAEKADQMANRIPWGYGWRPNGTWGATETPEALRLRERARRLYARMHAVAQLLSLHGDKYTPWYGVRS